MITYTTTLDGVTPADLAGFFVGWPSPPDPPTRLAVLTGSTHVVLAYDDDRLVGFVTALSDGVLMSSIPLLEVLPEYQRAGIGRELVNRVLDIVGDRYGVDLCCDDDLVGYYERFGFVRLNGMVLRPAIRPRVR